MKIELKWLSLDVALGKPTTLSVDIKLDSGDVIHGRNLTGDIWIGRDDIN